MPKQTPKRDWFYWVILAFTGVQLVWTAGLVVDFIMYPLAQTLMFPSSIFRLILALLIMPLAFCTAFIVIRRQPTSVVGVLLLLWGTQIASATLRTDSFLSSYSGIALGWIGFWLIPFFFPDGRIFPIRWSGVIKVLATILIVAAWFYTLTTPDFASSTVLNHWYVPALAALFPLINIVESASLVMLAAFIIPSLMMRFRAGNLTTRRQMTWLGWVFSIVVFVGLLLAPTGILQSPVSSLSTFERLALTGFTIFVYLSPYIAVSNAILRHRLYDIDIIIRRTLIYSVLTGILAIVYFGAIILTQQLFRAATGETPDIAIVISTLLIAALFSPVRRRVQDVIDRRLYRRKYDVEKTLAGFQQTLRDEVDMETLKSNLVGVVSETMQPTRIALWVKPDAVFHAANTVE
ncbi:MAG: hypothetical protein KME04_04285 [Pleurocapsa minor GSE-CHR-MK-17-07R]|jgi:hypothetical protein|nr:hypothetical protein [Pleurocapsa minor GSE-CHR-MK 17-07R]